MKNLAFLLLLIKRLIKPSEVHQFITQSNQELKYYIPRFRLVGFQKSFTYTSVEIWNNIEKKLKQLSYAVSVNFEIPIKRY